MLRITETQEKALNKLAKFRFLTADQLRKLGVSSDINHIRQSANKLAKVRPAVLGKMDYGSMIGHGRLPVVYYLTPHGASILADINGVEEEDINYPKGRVDAKTDYFHRLGCVEFRVRLSLELAEGWDDMPDYLQQKHPRGRHDLTRYWAYYDYRGANKGNETTGRLRQLTTFYHGTKRVTPDGMFWVKTLGDPNKRLFIFEYSRGMATKRVVDQFFLHFEMLVKGRYTEFYKLYKMPRICWVFDTENGMRAVQKRLKKTGVRWTVKTTINGQDQTIDFRPAIYFKTYDQMLADFNGGWSYVDPESTETRGLFDF